MRSPALPDAPPPRAERPGRGLALLRRVELWLLCLLLSLVVLCVLWGIVTRYVSPRPSPWTIEVATIAFCWSCLIGAGALYAQRIHPRVFEPAQLFLRPLRPWARGFSLVVEAVVLVAVGYFGGREVLAHLDNPTSVLRLPVSIYYLPLVWFSLSGLLGLLLGR